MQLSSDNRKIVLRLLAATLGVATRITRGDEKIVLRLLAATRGLATRLTRGDRTIVLAELVQIDGGQFKVQDYPSLQARKSSGSPTCPCEGEPKP